MQAPIIIWQFICSVNTQKTNLQQFFLQCWRLYDSNFSRTVLHQGDLLKKFKENNLPNVNFLKLLTKGNPLECFHQLTNYQQQRRIYRNFVEKSMCKQSRLFDHQNYAKKNKQKHSGFCIEKKHLEARWILRPSKLHRKK